MEQKKLRKVPSYNPENRSMDLDLEDGLLIKAKLKMKFRFVS
jgi:hypothetical protein